MKKIIKFIFVLGIFLTSLISVAQPPDPDSDPNSGGGTELGGNATISGGVIILILLGGIYATRKMYFVRKKDDAIVEIKGN